MVPIKRYAPAVAWLDASTKPGEEGNDADEENGLPRCAVVVHEGASERHTAPSGGDNPQQARTAHGPRVKSVLTDRPERSDARHDRVQALMDDEPDQQWNADAKGRAQRESRFRTQPESGLSALSHGCSMR